MTPFFRKLFVKTRSIARNKGVFSKVCLNFVYTSSALSGHLNRKHINPFKESRVRKMELRVIIAKVISILRRERPIIKRPVNSFVRKVKGVIHVGANSGQERDIYKEHGLHVFWVEPIPEMFKILKENIKEYPNQRAAEYLVSDQEDREYQFHIANNNGESSSILELKHHKDIWPKIGFEKTITLKSKTLPSVLKTELVDLSKYDALIMDTQGAELLILKGAVSILENFKFIKVEVPDFEAYEGCCTLSDITSFLTPFGYKEYARHKFKDWNKGMGGYYDIVYRRSNLLSTWNKLTGNNKKSR